MRQIRQPNYSLKHGRAVRLEKNHSKSCRYSLKGLTLSHILSKNRHHTLQIIFSALAVYLEPAMRRKKSRISVKARIFREIIYTNTSDVGCDTQTESEQDLALYPTEKEKRTAQIFIEYSPKMNISSLLPK